MAVDYFLKFQGQGGPIEGESQDSVHKGEIEIEDWNFGETQSGSAAFGQGVTVGRVSPQDFHIIKRIDKSSPKLFLACATGQHFETAVLTARKAGTTQQEFLIWTFGDLIVSSYHTQGSAQSDIVPRDEIAFNFSKLTCEYRVQQADGSLGGSIRKSWDMKRNMAA